MKDIYPIQEVVETVIDPNAKDRADYLYDLIIQDWLPTFLPEYRDNLKASDDDWENLFEPAVRWKIIEKLAAQLHTSAEGWCEVYHRALKRRYEGDE